MGEEAGRDDDCCGEDRAGVFLCLRFWFEGFGQGRWSLTFKIGGALWVSASGWGGLGLGVSQRLAEKRANVCRACAGFEGLWDGPVRAAG
jgi:hypothetical protein